MAITRVKVVVAKNIVFFKYYPIKIKYKMAGVREIIFKCGVHVKIFRHFPEKWANFLAKSRKMTSLFGKIPKFENYREYAEISNFHMNRAMII